MSYFAVQRTGLAGATMRTPSFSPASRRTRSRTARAPLAAATAILAPVLLGGCDLVTMNPAGDVARQQAHLILASTALMLLIIVPVIALTILFAWKYRHTNEDADYKPNWDHSTGLELIIWSAPLLIVIALGALTWISTHSLDPYRPLGRLAPGKPVAKNEKPLEIQVVSLDWKWLFIYPEQGIATVNELVLPINRQVVFRMTSSSVMNTFYVPTMAGMCTKPGETCMQATMMKDGAKDSGHNAPVNDTGHMRGSESKGALQKEPEEKGSSPHRNAPRQQAPGSSQPGSEANRSMTAIDPLPLPGATAPGVRAVARS